ncbi:MAG: hypothetical protein NZ874_03085 [Fimbriimonadales bacterium]|nr:hypothetical protein [Fimbriimonadales bacterium]
MPHLRDCLIRNRPVRLTAQAVPAQTKPTSVGFQPAQVGLVCTGTA